MADKPPAPIYRSQGNGLFRTDAGSRIIPRGQNIPYNVNGAPTGASVANADYGDIVVSGGVWSIDPSVLSTFGRSLIDDVDAATARVTLGLGTAAVASKAAASSATYVAPSGGTTVDTEGRASLAQLAADVADLRTKLQAAQLQA